MSTSVSFAGRELIAAWNGLDRGLCAFVLQLEEFNASCAWAEDGHASCVSWLADKCSMSRTDAFRKLHMSRELTRRHTVRAAFEAGLPFTKVSWLVRLDGVNEERDAEFVMYAETDSVRVLEERVRNWNYFNTQDKKPTDLDDHYGMYRSRGVCGGMGRVTIDAPDDFLDRFDAVVDAYGEFLRRSKNGDESQIGTDAGKTLEEQPRPRAARRLDALLDLLEEAALADPRKIDPYVAAVGVTIQYEDLMAKTGNGLSSQGSSLTPEAISRLCCDAGIHRVVVKGQSEILDFGRDERLFNRATRRAIRFRHGHCCAVRGCGRRVTFIHHIDHFEDGGETTIYNGIPLCSYHHHRVHEGGWDVAWNPTTGVVTLEGPRGQVLRTTASFLRAA